MLLQLFSLTLGHSWDTCKQESALSTKLLIIYYTVDLTPASPSNHRHLFLCLSFSLTQIHTSKGCDRDKGAKK